MLDLRSDNASPLLEAEAQVEAGGDGRKGSDRDPLTDAGRMDDGVDDDKEENHG